MNFLRMIALLLFVYLVAANPARAAASTGNLANRAMTRRAVNEGLEIAKVIATEFWKAQMTPHTVVTMLIKIMERTLPVIIEAILNVFVRILTAMEPFAEAIEIAGRMWTTSGMGRKIVWDPLDCGLRHLSVDEECRPKASCEFGYILQLKDGRVARVLKAIGAGPAERLPHWTGFVKGLRGAQCFQLYPDCNETFLGGEASPQSNGQPAEGLQY